MMSKDLREILQAFNAHGVRYLVVGGFAFGAYSEPRTMKDIGLWIRTDTANAKAVFEALAEFGAPIAGMSLRISRTERSSTLASLPIASISSRRSTASALMKRGPIEWKAQSKE